jgi:hypothetical protein
LKASTKVLPATTSWLKLELPKDNEFRRRDPHLFVLDHYGRRRANPTSPMDHSDGGKRRLCNRRRDESR